MIVVSDTSPINYLLLIDQLDLLPRLFQQIIGDGNGIHWNQLDEDVSIKNLILGQRSRESQKSFQRWLSGRIVAI